MTRQELLLHATKHMRDADRARADARRWPDCATEFEGYASEHEDRANDYMRRLAAATKLEDMGR